MNFTDLYIMAQEVEQPGLFPFPFGLHIIFTIVAVIFMIFRFVKEKKPYQLIMAIAFPISLIICTSENKTLFYTIGIIEAVLMLAAFVSSILFKKPKETSAAEPSEEEKEENA